MKDELQPQLKELLRSGKFLSKVGFPEKKSRCLTCVAWVYLVRVTIWSRVDLFVDEETQSIFINDMKADLDIIDDILIEEHTINMSFSEVMSLMSFYNGTVIIGNETLLRDIRMEH